MFTADELRQMINIEKGEDTDIPTMLRLLFYCSLLYLFIFVTVQMIPAREISIMKDLVGYTYSRARTL